MRQTQKEKLLPEQTAEKIRGYIEGNGLKVGDKLPNEFQLAEICGVGRSTVREAIKLLVFSGKVEVIRGSGTYIKKEKASQASPAVNDDPIGLQENSEENLVPDWSGICRCTSDAGTGSGSYGSYQCRLC